MPHHRHDNQQPWPSWLWSNKSRRESTLASSTTVQTNAYLNPRLEPSSAALDQEHYLGLQGPLGHPSRYCQACSDHGSGQCMHGSCSMEKNHCSLDVDADDLHPSRRQRLFYRSSMEKETGEEESGDNEETHLFTGFLPHAHPQRNAIKGLHSLLRFVNIVCIALILLFCIAVLNLLSTPTRPATGAYEHSSPTGVAVTDQCLKGKEPLSTRFSPIQCFSIPCLYRGQFLH